MQERKRTAFKYKIYEKEYEVYAPNMRQVHEFSKKVKADPEKEVELSIGFLGGLGIPEDDAWEMEPAHLKEVIDNVCGQKKS